jgi:hypothetical protein
VFGQPGINRLAIGVGMIPRGEVGLVFAGVGAASGVLSDATEAAIIMMVILTTFIAPPLLRLVFQEPVEATSSLNQALDGTILGTNILDQTSNEPSIPEEVETAPEPNKEV